MDGQVIKKVVIAGGGTAGWCVAAALSKMLGNLLDITLVESAEIGIVGVGEATIPTIKTFHQFLGIDERDFMRSTNAAIKLGISFDNWTRINDHYFHSFGTVGKASWMAPFHHIWMHARDEGVAGDLGDYCLELQAGEAGKFEVAERSRLNYAYHFDTNLYGPFMRRISQPHVNRVEGKITGVNQDAETGFVTSIAMESGQVIEGDLFIDCTGFRGILIEQTLKTGYEDWSHWLANDSAWACQTPIVGQIMPYTSAIAHDAGWRWKIPLQSRVGNGLVYSSKHLSDDAARQRFLDQIDAPPLTEPNLIKFRTGRRLKIWNKNVIAFGLASGFIEPLESTNIHLMQSCATRLVQLFPFTGIHESMVNHFNDLTQNEVALIRDFVIMHYKLTERDDTQFWRDRRDMEVPETLAHRLAMYRDAGHAFQAPDEVFRVDSWMQVTTGQRLYPKGYHYVGKMIPRGDLEQALKNMKADIDRKVAQMPKHEDFIRQYSAEAAPVA